MVRRVSVEALLHDARSQTQRVTADGDFHRLEIEPVGPAGPYERLDLLDDLRLERCAEPPFLAASGEVASGASS